MGIIEKYKTATTKGKIAIISIFVLIVGGIDLYLLSQMGTLIKLLPNADKSRSNLYYAFKGNMKWVSLFISLALVLLIALVLLRVNKKNFTVKDDSRGVHFMSQGTHGTAEWMDETKAEEVFNVANIEDTTSEIYGQFTDHGERVVSYKKPKGASLSRNTLLLASSGSGKSYCFVRPNFLQNVDAGNSVVVSDPGGTLFGDLSQYCRDKGIDTHVINLSDPAYSETWDVIKECINPDTERLDSLRVNQFVEIYMTNTGEGKKDFWYIAAENLLKTVICYAAFWNEKIVISGYKKLFMKIVGLEMENDDIFFHKLNEGLVSFKWCRNYIISAATQLNRNLEDVYKAFELIKEDADYHHPFTFERVYYLLNNFSRECETVLNDDEQDSDEAKPQIIPHWHPAWINYQVYKSNDSENVRKSALQGAQLRMAAFADPHILHIVSNPGLNLNEFNTKQTVLFVITSDKSQETKPIASLLFSFLFKDCQDVYDKYEQRSYGSGKPNPCVPTAVILDDFYSLGVIGGTGAGGSGSSVFATLCSDARKRQISLVIVCQSYSQIEAVYGEKVRDSIQGNCSTLVYLGGNDPSTIDFISTFAGESTVLSESHQEASQLFQTGVLHPGYRASAVQRAILTLGEARTWKNKVLVIRQGEQPLILDPFPWVQLPAYKKCKPTNIYSYLSPFDEVPAIYVADNNNENGIKEKSVGSTLRDELDSLYNKIAGYKINPETGELVSVLKKFEPQIELDIFAPTKPKEEVVKPIEEKPQPTKNRRKKTHNKEKYQSEYTPSIDDIKNDCINLFDEPERGSSKSETQSQELPGSPDSIVEVKEGS